jgi:polyhydroxyalkanoate synthesis regulator protein
VSTDHIRRKSVYWIGGDKLDEQEQQDTVQLSREELLAKQAELGQQKLAIFEEIKHLQPIDRIDTPQQKQIDELDKQLWDIRHQLEQKEAE